MDKRHICTIFLLQFKLSRKAAETTHDTNDTFGRETNNEHLAQS